MWIYDNSYHQIIDFRIWSQLIEEQAQNKNKVRRMDFKWAYPQIIEESKYVEFGISKT